MAAFDADLLDPDVLTALHEFRVPGEADPAAEVAQAFLEVTPARLSDLRQAAARRDAGEVRRLAHQVRGSCGAVGAAAMAQVAAEIEGLDQGVDASPAVARLADAFAQTGPLLDALVRDNSDTGVA